MSGRNRSEKAHHDHEISKRQERVMTSGESGSKPLNWSSRQATHEAGEPVVKTHPPEEVDETGARAAFGIDESAQRDKGVNIPDSPYQVRG